MEREGRSDEQWVEAARQGDRSRERRTGKGAARESVKPVVGHRWSPPANDIA